MRILVVLILLAFGYQRQQTTVNGQQTLCTVPEPVEGTTLGASTSSATAYSRTVDCCPLSIDFYESQIRIADSLYKNYLPQSNFEEVKAAVEFFDSYQPSAISGQRWRFFDSYQPSAISGQRWRLFGKEADDENRLIAESRQLTAAKAHYYHAVGLTEKDDIVGACEHYLIALEIMDPLVETHRRASRLSRTISVDNPEDYEKIRFVALIYTRLGQLFLNENYCDIAIKNYKKALKYVKILENSESEANILKSLANSYQLSNKADSALYYYNESLKTSSDISNKLDINKSIAQIMFFNKGKRDSAYVILKNNLNKISKENVKYSYHFTLGNMFYNDKAYDSALYYLEKSLDNGIITQKLSFTTTLSAIYDSLGNYEKKAYYDNLSSKLFKNNINKGIDKTQLQVLYDNYNKRRTERERITAKAKIIRLTITISLSVVVLSISLIMFIRYKHKRHSYILSEEINVKEKRIRDNEFKFSLIDGKIKSKNMELQRKEEEIRLYQNEIAELRSRMESKKDNIKEYNQSEICMKILNEISELSKSGKNTSELQALRQDEFAMLLQSAKLHLSTFLKNTSDKYPTLKKEDFYYLCLVIINLNDKQIASLFGLSYEAIRKRKNKIASVLGVQNKDNFYNNIMELL